MPYVKVAEKETFESGKARLFEIEGLHIAVFRIGDEFYAIDDKCSHRGGPLSEGTLNGFIVRCPWHQGCFDVRTGQIAGGIVARAQHKYRVRVENGNVEVEI